jgi:hypothetical protein
VKAAGLNLMDTYVRRGPVPIYRFSPLALGVDGPGVVIQVGEQSNVKAGDRVAWEHAPLSYADLVEVPGDRLIPIPETVTFEAGPGALMWGLTAHYLSHVAVPVSKDRWRSGIQPARRRRMLTQLTSQRGGQVIAAVSRGHKARGPGRRRLAGAGARRDRGSGRGDPGPHRRRGRGHRVRQKRLSPARRRYLRHLWLRARAHPSYQLVGTTSRRPPR